MMYGQMTAGSWIYIGTQGILQGPMRPSQKRRGSTSARTQPGGQALPTAGLGGMGGAQPLAATMLGGVCLAIEIDQSRIERRIEHRYLDRWTADVDEAIKWVMDAKLTETPLSVGLLGNAAELLLLAERQAEAELVSDQTSAHDPLVGYIPAGMSLAEAEALRGSDKPAYLEAVGESMAAHVRGLLAFMSQGRHVFDYGNNLRARAQEAGVSNAFDYPVVPAYIRPLL